MSDDLVAFLKSCVDEDERVAKAATSGPWSAVESYPDAWVINGPTYNIASEGRDGDISSGDSAHIARHDPARVLAEVAAKRRIIDEYERSRSGPPTEDELGLGRAVRLLASVYRGRSGWRSEWAPDGEETP